MSRRDTRKFHKRDEENRVRNLHSELKKVWDARANLNWIELDKPYFLGYIKRFRLRDDCKRRKDAAVYENILSKINSKVKCKNKTFVAKDWKTGKKVDIFPTLKRLGKKEYNKLTQKEQRLFREYYSHKHCCWLYEFTESHYFETCIDKNYAYKVREHDAVLDRRESELNNKIDRENLWPMINRMNGYGNSRIWDKLDKQRRINKEKRIEYIEVLGSLDKKIYKIKL